jgi:hypothetical protein
MDVSVPTELLNKLINLGGLKKTLHCDKCKDYTEHVSISISETAPKDKTFEKILGRFLDNFPGMPLMAGNPFACMKCKKVKLSGGLLSDVMRV